MELFFTGSYKSFFIYLLLWHPCENPFLVLPGTYECTSILTLVSSKQAGLKPLQEWILVCFHMNIGGFDKQNTKQRHLNDPKTVMFQGQNAKAHPIFFIIPTMLPFTVQYVAKNALL